MDFRRHEPGASGDESDLLPHVSLMSKRIFPGEKHANAG
jgi:hypothetical protein